MRPAGPVGQRHRVASWTANVTRAGGIDGARARRAPRTRRGRPSRAALSTSWTIRVVWPGPQPRSTASAGRAGAARSRNAAARRLERRRDQRQALGGQVGVAVGVPRHAAQRTRGADGEPGYHRAMVRSATSVRSPRRSCTSTSRDRCGHRPCASGPSATAAPLPHGADGRETPGASTASWTSSRTTPRPAACSPSPRTSRGSAGVLRRPGGDRRAVRGGRLQSRRTTRARLGRRLVRTDRGVAGRAGGRTPGAPA